MAKARPIPGLEPDDSYALAAAKVVAVRAGELVEHSAGVLDLGEIEAVHRMRVATRRLRAALEVFEPCFPRKRHRRALKEVKRLADALGERRDRDVAIAGLTEFGEAVAAADRRGVESLVARLREEQLAANEALAPMVADERLVALSSRLTELVGEARRIAPEAGDEEAAPVPLERIPPPLSAPAVPVTSGNGMGSR
jgi:CHAD domain-containing protein